jgi:hypothetical protein
MLRWGRQAIRVTLRRFSSSAPNKSSRTLLGTTAGTTIFVLSGTVVMWPVSDLYLGPMLVQQGLVLSSQPIERALKEDNPSIYVISDHGLALRQKAEETNRPVIYISLREATSSHDMFMGKFLIPNYWILNDKS